MTAAHTPKQLVEREIQELWNDKDLSVVDDMYSDDITLHYPGQPSIEGRAHFGGFVDMYLSAFPDLSIEVDDVIAEGDRVACRYTQQGTHRGRLLGLEATNNRMRITGTAIRRIENDQIAELWITDDSVGLLRQLDAFPRLVRPKQTPSDPQA